MRIPALILLIVFLGVWLIASWLISLLSWTVVIGLVLWGIILLWVMHRMGKLAAFPALSAVFDRISPSSGTPAAQGVPSGAGAPKSSAPAAVPAPAPSLHPQHAGTYGVQRIDALYGLETAKQQLDGLLTLAVAARKSGQAGFGMRAPATMLVFQGPPGTGKTEMAIAYLHLLYGAGVVPSDSYYQLTSAEIAGQSAGSANLIGRQAAEAAMDGVLIIENAEWMVEHSGDARFSTEVARGLMHVIERYPRRLIIIATGNPGLSLRLNNDAALKRDLLNKIHIEDVDFDELPTDTLVRLFNDHAKSHQVRVASDMQARLPTLIQALKRAESEHFDNAHAVRRWFDRVYSRARRRDGHATFIELTAEDFRLEAA